MLIPGSVVKIVMDDAFKEQGSSGMVVGEFLTTIWVDTTISEVTQENNGASDGTTTFPDQAEEDTKDIPFT